MSDDRSRESSGTASKPLPITGLGHIALATKRLAESRAFYRGVLGFQEVERPNFDFNGAWLHQGGLMIHLIESQTAGDPMGPINSRGDHVALAAEDMDAIERGLQARGIEYRKGRMAGDGIVQIFFRDPDGHTIELSARLPIPPPIV